MTNKEKIVEMVDPTLQGQYTKKDLIQVNVNNIIVLLILILVILHMKPNLMLHVSLLLHVRANISRLSFINGCGAIFIKVFKTKFIVSWNLCGNFNFNFVTHLTVKIRQDSSTYL